MDEKWISVKDKTPNNVDMVLCYCESKDCPTQNYTLASFLGSRWDDGLHLHEHIVTHWMPLAEPPNKK